MRITSDIKQIAKVFTYADIYGKVLSFGIFLTLVDIIANILIAKGQEILLNIIRAGDLAQLIRMLKICVIAILVIPIVNYVGDYIRAYYPALIRQSLALRVFDQINRLPFPVIQRKHSGDLVARVSRDVENISAYTISSMSEVFYNILLCGVSFVYLAQMDLPLALLVIAIGPITFGSGRFFDKKIRDLTLQENNQAAHIRGFLQEAFQGVQEIKHFSAQTRFTAEYDRLRAEQNALLQKKAAYQILMTQTVQLINTGLTVLLIYATGVKVMDGSLRVGAIIAFIYLLGRVQEPFIGLSTVFGNMQVGLAASDRVFELMEVQPEEALTGQSISVVDEKNVIEFTNVSFTYTTSEGTKVFKNVNFTVKQGETVALIGPSGTGKSTIAKLCCGLYEPDAGEIKVFGHNVRENRVGIRSLIAYVPQNSYLFRTTIAENIAYGREQISSGAIPEAARQASCTDFIDGLPDQFTAMVSEMGKNLSGGQRQRIAMARAFLRQAPLLILDEPTSALDQENVQAIKDGIAKLMQQQSTLATLIITHDLTLVENVSRILVIQDGQVIVKNEKERLDCR